MIRRSSYLLQVSNAWRKSSLPSKLSSSLRNDYCPMFTPKKSIHEYHTIRTRYVNESLDSMKMESASFCSSSYTQLNHLWPAFLFVASQVSDMNKNAKCESENDENDVKQILKKTLNDLKEGKLDSALFDKAVDSVYDSLSSQAHEALIAGVPGKLSYGFICGFSSGYALKKVGKVAAVAVGLGFITIQTLSYNGYVQVDFEQIKEDAKKKLDFNDDGSTDELDTKELMDKIYEVLSHNIPAGSGFGGGFFLGIRAG